MSSWKGHIIWAAIIMLIVGIILAYLKFLNINWFIKTWTDWFLLIPLLLFYAIIVDIDSPASIPRFIVTAIILGLIIYFAFLKSFIPIIILAVILLLVWIMKYIPGFGHRGYLHSFIFIILISLPLIYFNWTWVFLGIFMAFTHLLIDTFTGKPSVMKLWN